MTEPREIAYSEESRGDLDAIFDHIAGDSPDAAHSLIDHIERRIEILSAQPWIGHKRHRLPQRFRVLSLDRKVTIVYTVQPRRVDVLRIFYGGQDYDAILAKKLQRNMKSRQ